MAQSFSITYSPRFRRAASSLIKHHPDFVELLVLAVETLRTDPTNATRRYRIKHLAGTRKGPREYRLRLRQFRFLYDVEGKKVELVFCGLRREDTYK